MKGPVMRVEGGYCIAHERGQSISIFTVNGENITAQLIFKDKIVKILAMIVGTVLLYCSIAKIVSNCQSESTMKGIDSAQCEKFNCLYNYIQYIKNLELLCT